MHLIGNMTFWNSFFILHQKERDLDSTSGIFQIFIHILFANVKRKSCSERNLRVVLQQVVDYKDGIFSSFWKSLVVS